MNQGSLFLSPVSKMSHLEGMVCAGVFVKWERAFGSALLDRRCLEYGIYGDLCLAAACLDYVPFILGWYLHGCMAAWKLKLKQVGTRSDDLRTAA